MVTKTAVLAQGRAMRRLKLKQEELTIRLQLDEKRERLRQVRADLKATGGRIR